MKKYISLSLLFCSTLNVAAKDLKLGTVDPSYVIVNSPKWKDMGTHATKEMEKRYQEINAKQAEMQKKAKDLESMGSLANQETRAKKEEELVQLRSEIEIKYKSLQSYEQRMSQEAQMEILKDIEEATEQIAREEDIDMVTAGAVIYAKKDLNLTEKVLERVSKNYETSKTKKPEQKHEVQPKQTASSPVKAAENKQDKKADKPVTVAKKETDNKEVRV